MTSPSPGTITLRHVAALAAGWTAVLAILLASRGVVADVAHLFPEDLPPNPYFVPSEFLRLYVVLPVSILAGVAFLLAPGILWSLARGRTESASGTVLGGFCAAFLLHLLAMAFAALVAPRPTPPGVFLMVEIGLAAALLVNLGLRVRAGRKLCWPLSQPGERRRVAWMAALPVAACVLLLPALFWEDCTADGMEALEMGRSLAWKSVPWLPTGRSGAGLGIGMISMAYPTHFMIQLFGPVEAVSRLPLLLYLPVLFAGLTALVEAAAPRRLRALEELAIVAAMAGLVVTLGYSASYDPYTADVAAPTAFETLTLLCMTGVLWAFWTDRPATVIVFALLCYFARPTGLLFLGLLGAATWIFDPPQRGRAVRQIGGAVAACMLAFVLYELGYLRTTMEPGSIAYASSTIRSRFQYLQLLDPERVLWVAVPCGVLPFVSLLTFGGSDRRARVLSVVVLSYFLFFLPHAFVSLHHFVPAMALPLVVFWRGRVQGADSPWPARVALAAAVAAVWISLPPRTQPFRGTRNIGRRVEFTAGALDGDWESYRRRLRSIDGFDTLFPPDWEVYDPVSQWASNPLGALHHSADPGEGPPDYRVQPAGDPAPEGWIRAGEKGGYAGFARDEVIWARDRAAGHDTDFRCPLYEIPRETLFPHAGIPAGAYTVNLKRVPLVGRLFGAGSADEE